MEGEGRIDHTSKSLDMSKEKTLAGFSKSVNLPPLPKTKEQLKEKDLKLRKELNDLRKKYRNVYTVISNLGNEYEVSKESLVFTRYGRLKFLIKQATTDQVLEESRPPEHKHSVANKGVENAFSHGTSEAASQHRGHSSARERYYEPAGAKGLLNACKKFAGNADDVVNKGAPRDVNTMHKAEIEEDIEQLKHHLHMYDSKFLRAHNRLAKLKQDYQLSKGSIFLTRYGLLKGMIKVVTQDTTLKPD